MANIKRKMKSVEEHLCDAWTLEGKLSELYEQLGNWIEKYGEDAIVSHDYGWDGPSEFMIVYERLETEKEAEKRVAVARKARERRKAEKLETEEKERALLEKLQEKYGKD